ncbi:hypothetical protein ACTFIZ_004427, partial [Dictyostelium cf. discoideum]|jgi:hypothetical protein
LYL